MTPSTVALAVADEVQRHPLDEEIGLGAHVLLVQRVQHRVAGAVGRGAGALHRLLAVVGGVAAEGALVDRAVGVAVERHAHVLELVHHLAGLAAHELDGVLIAEPVRALHGVVEVVVPVVLGHVAEAGADATLRRHRVAARREDLGQHGHVQARQRELQRSAHARAAGADDDDVEAAPGEGLGIHCHRCSRVRSVTQLSGTAQWHSLVAQLSRSQFCHRILFFFFFLNVLYTLT